MVREPVIVLVVLGALVWLGMGVSMATVLRRAGIAPLRAWLIGLLAWPLVLRRVRQMRG